MSEKSKCFTFIWKIKNFSFMCGQRCSPSFFVEAMSETNWKLQLYPRSNSFEACVACYLRREINDGGPDRYELDHELSFLANDGSVLHPEKHLKSLFVKGGCDYKALHMKIDVILSSNKVLFIPDDTLTICCRMWDCQNTISQAGMSVAETRIETECTTYVGIIEKFSSIEAISNIFVSIKSSSKETFVSSMNLSVAADGKLVIELKPVDYKSIEMYRCKIFIRDVFGNNMKSGQVEYYDTKPQRISLAISKEYLIENKRYYLPGDVLTIECEIILSTGRITDKIDEPVYGFDYENIPESISKVPKTNLFSEAQNIENLRTLKEDWISLLREGILCDTKLKTATEIFPAHTAVLGARSPVFKSIFTLDMKEKTNKCVDIEDLDADTVRRMLLFMYSATLEDLQFESAKSLYFAADKYNIVSLRQGCSKFLKQNLLQANCCDTLLLADKHQDKDLMNAVQDFIAENDGAVLYSNKWKNLEKNHPQLTTEVLRTLYLKNRGI